MKIFIFSIMLITSLVTLNSQADETEMTNQNYGIVHTEDLKNWYDEGIEMVVLDVRSPKYFNDILLPDALWVPYNAPMETIEEAIPSKESLIVLYCWGPNCPMSDRMSERLIQEGYTNIYKYIDGQEDWLDQDLPTTEITDI